MHKFLLTALFINSVYGQSTPELCQKLANNGSGKDSQARTVLMKKTHNISFKSQNEQAKHELALLQALIKTKDQGLATFYLQQLELCGSKASIPVIGKLLKNKLLGSNAARTLIELAQYDLSTTNEILIKAHHSAQDETKLYIINAMSVLGLKDSRAMKIYHSSLKVENLKRVALQGLAMAGDRSDQKTFISAFAKAAKTARGTAFRLNLVFAKNLARSNKETANQHLLKLRTLIGKNEVPYQAGIVATTIEINGIREQTITSLLDANTHTQSAFLRILKMHNFKKSTALFKNIVDKNPNQSFYLEAFAAVNQEAAKNYISSALSSQNQELKNTAGKLAIDFGSDFAPALITTLMAKGEFSKEDIKIAKSMIHPAKISEVTSLWKNLSPTIELAFISMTENIRQPEVATKVLSAAESKDSKVKKEAQKVLKNVVSARDLPKLRQLLNKETNSSAVRYIQAGLSSSLAQSDKKTIDQLARELSQKRHDKLLVALAKSNQPQVLHLLKKDLTNSKPNLQKEAIKSLSSMNAELNLEALVFAVEKVSDERNKILAVRALANSLNQSTQPVSMKKAFLERALKSKLQPNEAKMMQDILKKISPASKKKKKAKAKPSESTKTYSPLFNGKDLNQWDNQGDYKVVDGVISGANGRLWSKKTYSNFSLKFEFKLEPGTNNGLAIRTPKGQKPLELQIIDNPHPRYAKIKDYQRHGSIYSYVPAKTGFLKKAGEWNKQEVICDGSMVTVILNGTIILEADLSTVKPQPGSRYKVKYINDAKEGHIGFLGHKAPIQFRAIEIKKL